MDILQQKQGRILFKLRTRMISVRNNFKRNMKTLCAQDARKRLTMKNIYKM